MAEILQKHFYYRHQLPDDIKFDKLAPVIGGINVRLGQVSLI